ncbi:hypothetical protein BSKO_13637 [Bryopsis sp. KO-2023]|nr:hypothetical protein BSKO_13637 [Bryopsis sp. KO-2023]
MGILKTWKTIGKLSFRRKHKKTRSLSAGTNTKTGQPTSASQAFNHPESFDTIVNGPNENKFYCFRSILLAGSSLFREMLNPRNVGDPPNEVYILDVQPEVLEGLLRFLHTREINLTVASLFQFLVVADKFDIPALKDACLSFEREKLEVNIGNCCWILSESIKIKYTDLAHRCMDFVVSNVGRLNTSEQFLELDHGILVELLKHASEMFHDYRLKFGVFSDLVKGIRLWIDHTEKKAAVTEVLNSLPFEICSQYELAELMSTKAVQENPGIATAIVRGVKAGFSPKADSIMPKGQLLKEFEGESSRAFIPWNSRWKGWTVPETGWYYILAKGGKGASAKKGTDKGVFQGGNGTIAGGALFLYQGDKLRILVGKTVSGGGGSCVVLIPGRPNFRPLLLLVAGGGGGGGIHKSGGTAQLDVGLSLMDSITSGIGSSGKQFKLVDYSGHGCGDMISVNRNPSAYKGPCSWCDGGKGGGPKVIIGGKHGGGGAGFHGGRGDLKKGGSGGGTFVSISAVNVFCHAGNELDAGIKIFKGRDIPKDVT